tara:strand:- start:618 stop:839 length:222 start_codon:yes stop_codon:yes gene_type:complete
MNKKKYKIFFNRTYYSYIEVEYPDDGRDHIEIIDKLIQDGDQEIWNEMAEAEVSQMGIEDEEWEIVEVKPKNK